MKFPLPWSPLETTGYVLLIVVAVVGIALLGFVALISWRRSRKENTNVKY